ncbi:5'-nucleotidase C-terminal domain-containing protein [Helcococcus ovis]|uniref:bifunctional metallophosphatase/5'-nucleotidase n=1 Tax=Helcococcus ovis TaxID=72026 RepID=UPI0038B71AC6
MKNKLKVTLLCTSDVHGYYMPWDYSKDQYSKTGGLSRVSTYVNSLRKENEHVVLMDNGDLIQGNSAEYFINREKYPGIEVINKMKYEIYNMGNHEFNFGMDHLIDVVRQFNGVSMMGNLYRKKNTMRFMNGVYYKNIKGIRIGFVSLNTPLVRKFEAKRGNLKNFDVIDADFELERLLKEVGECDALIGLFHMGDFNENDIENTGIIDLLNNVKGAEKIDAIFGGHMHQIINKKINNTIFLEPGYHAEGLSRLDLTFDIDSKKLEDIRPSIIKIDEEIESDEEIEDILAQYHKELRERANEFIGYTSEDLSENDDVKGIAQTRVAQTKVTDFFLDVMLDYSGADVVSIHLDNPYPVILKGEIKRKNINNSYSYSGGEISIYNILGSDLKKYIEWSAGVFNKFYPDDINISFNPERIKFKYSTFDIFGNIKYDIDLNEDEGNRIKNLRKMDDTEISDDEILKLGINKYRMDYLISLNGPLSGLKMSPISSSITDKSLNVRGTIRNLSVRYIGLLPNKLYVPKNIKRWNVLLNNSNDELRKFAINLINEGSLLLYKLENGKTDFARPLNLNEKLEKYQIEKLKEKYDFNEDLILREILNEIKRGSYEV